MSDELLWCPPGYIPFRKARTEALEWARNGVIDSAYVTLFDGPEMMAEIFGSVLVDGTLRTVGVSVASGRLMTIPPMKWRRLHLNQPYSTCFTYPVQAALDGYPIWVGDEPSQELCNVAVALADLARPLGASPVPPDPAERPDGLQDQGSSPPRSAPAQSGQNVGGAPPKHNWDEFWIEVVRYAASTGLCPDGRLRLHKYMENWTATRWQTPPDSSTIGKRMSRLYGRSGRTLDAEPQRDSMAPMKAEHWQAFWIEVAHYVAANRPDWRLGLRKHVEEWLKRTSRDRLDTSAVRHRLDCLFEALGAG